MTSEDTSTTKTYTVTVTRATRASAVLVSNSGQSDDGTGLVGLIGIHFTSEEIKFSSAQRFTTGDNASGYALSSIEVHIDGFVGAAEIDIPGVGADEARVSIYSADASGGPGSSLFVLTNPGSVTNASLNTFNAANVTLEKETQYFVVVEAVEGNFSVGRTSSNAEESASLTGWSIRDERQVRPFDSGAWRVNSDKVRIEIRGAAAFTDAPLSGLALEDGDGNTISLGQTFAPGTMNYTVSVANDVDEVTLSATANGAGASVSGVTLNGTAITDDDFTDGIMVPSLLAGDNEIVLTVTAEDTSTTQTYTVTVTRAATPAGCEPGVVW